MRKCITILVICCILGISNAYSEYDKIEEELNKPYVSIVPLTLTLVGVSLIIFSYLSSLTASEHTDMMTAGSITCGMGGIAIIIDLKKGKKDE